MSNSKLPCPLKCSAENDYLNIMRNLFCIALTIVFTTIARGQIYLTPQGNATSALGLARNQLIRVAESNMDVFVPSNNDFSMGWVLALADAEGKTQIKFLCADTALESQVSIHTNYRKDINWKNITSYPVARSIIIQPFIFSGPESRMPNAEDSAAAEARLKAWLVNQPPSSPMFLKPLVETIHVISCGRGFYVDKIPQSAIPKLVFRDPSGLNH